MVDAHLLCTRRIELNPHPKPIRPNQPMKSTIAPLVSCTVSADRFLEYVVNSTTGFICRVVFCTGVYNRSWFRFEVAVPEPPPPYKKRNKNPPVGCELNFSSHTIFSRNYLKNEQRCIKTKCLTLYQVYVYPFLVIVRFCRYF